MISLTFIANLAWNLSPSISCKLSFNLNLDFTINFIVELNNINRDLDINIDLNLSLSQRTSTATATLTSNLNLNFNPSCAINRDPTVNAEPPQAPGHGDYFNYSDDLFQYFPGNLWLLISHP